MSLGCPKAGLRSGLAFVGLTGGCRTSHVGTHSGALRLVAVLETPQAWPLPSRIGKDGKSTVQRLQTRKLTALQFSFGPGLFPDQADKPQAIELESVVLEVLAR